MKEQILWNNFYIRIENKPVYYNNWVVNGMLKIKQLQDTQGKFLDYDRFKKRFKKILRQTFLNIYIYISIVSAIKYFKSDFNPTNSHAT